MFCFALLALISKCRFWTPSASTALKYTVDDIWWNTKTNQQFLFVFYYHYIFKLPSNWKCFFIFGTLIYQWIKPAISLTTIVVLIHIIKTAVVAFVNVLVLLSVTIVFKKKKLRQCVKRCLNEDQIETD